MIIHYLIILSKLTIKMKVCYVIALLLMHFHLRFVYGNFNLRSINTKESKDHEIDCNLITTCYECNSPLSKCQWTGSKCRYNEAQSSYWFINLLQCQDDVSLRKSVELCHIENNYADGVFAIWLKKTNNSYNFSGGLFCIFPIEVHSRIIQLGVSSINIGMLGLKTITKGNKEEYYNNIPIENKEFKLKDIRQLILYYYSNNESNDSNNKDLPFKVEIEQIHVEWTISPMIILQITLGTLLFFVLMTVLVFLFVTYYRRRKQIDRSQERIHTFRANGSTPNKINKSINHQPVSFKCVIYDADKVKLYNEKCPICLERIEKKIEVIKLNCNHGFHEKCLSEWMEKNIQPNIFCPLCHLRIIPNEREKTEEGLITPNTPDP